MTVSSEVQDAVRARKQEAARLAEAANEAAKLEQEITSLRRELVPLVERQARLAALGNKQLQQPVKTHYPGIGLVEWQPLLSVKTGKELAADVQRHIDEIQGEITGREQRIQALVGE
jgi:hypothetical protein